MSIEVDHNGYTITYAENEDVWRCWALEMDAKTLSALRTKINKLGADARRLNVPLIHINYHDVAEPVRAVLLADPPKNQHSVQQVFCMIQKREYGRHINREGVLVEKREKLDITKLYLPTPEIKAAIAVWQAAQEKAAEATAAARKLKDALAPLAVTVADLAKLRKEGKEE